MRIIKRFIFVALFLLTSCAMQPQRLIQLTSRSPEVVINIDDFDRVKHEIIIEMQVAGFLLEGDSQYYMSFVKELFDVSSSQQENVKVEVTYNLSQIKKGIKVVLFSSVIWSYDPHGVVLKRDDMGDNKAWLHYFTMYYKELKQSQNRPEVVNS